MSSTKEPFDFCELTFDLPLGQVVASGLELNLLPAGAIERQRTLGPAIPYLEPACGR
jgi:hypothetical protein